MSPYKDSLSNIITSGILGKNAQLTQLIKRLRETLIINAYFSVVVLFLTGILLHSCESDGCKGFFFFFLNRDVISGDLKTFSKHTQIRLG